MGLFHFRLKMMTVVVFCFCNYYLQLFEDTNYSVDHIGIVNPLWKKDFTCSNLFGKLTFSPYIVSANLEIIGERDHLKNPRMTKSTFP